MISIKDLHHGYLLIKQMRVPIDVKVRVLSTLLAASPNPWPVVGITEEALKVFAKNDFRKTKRMGINRSHLNDRHAVYTTMLESEMSDCDAWWEYYIKNDKTILATSSENITSSFSKVHYFEEDMTLFTNAGFSWRHNKAERLFLEDLHKYVILPNTRHDRSSRSGL